MQLRNLIECIIDKKSFDEIKINLDYTGKDDEINSITIGLIKINSIDCILCINNAEIMGGTLGQKEGEKIAKALEIAYKRRLPIIFILNSGGARVQEGILSLFQLSKIVSAVYKFKQKRLLLISIIFNFVYGGMSASLVGLSDIIIMEKNSRFGFAGPELIKETYNKPCEDKFQSGVFVQKNGLVDIICSMEEMREILIKLLKLHGG